MALTDIALCSRALIKIGAAAIASFDDGTAEAEVAAVLYPSIRDGLLAAHPWSFATAQGSLPRLLAAPVADYAYAFQLPADFLRVLSAGVEGRGAGAVYRIAERRLHTDMDAVVLSYIFRPVESAFPPHFDDALIARLAADFCLPLTESTSRAELLDRQAEAAFRRARLTDAQQDTPSALSHFPLVEVRG
ncbi:MAG: hypothetical protein OQJ87_04710 [Rhodospirillales bacterium]|nr:hypothetical protein [Rhodospirillales bacterium]MCW9039547.1 hypothetical protein [Rhodospirillales bacterium]